MTFSDAAMVLAANGLRSGIKGVKLHSGDPGAGGAASRTNATAATPAWTTATADGDFSLATPLSFTGNTANQAVTYISTWSSTDLTTATWYGNFALSGDLTADASGNYTLESFTINGTAG